MSAKSSSTVPEAGRASELDLRTEEDRALARQAEVVGRLGGDHRGGEEELLAPAAHSRRVVGWQVDLERK